MATKTPTKPAKNLNELATQLGGRVSKGGDKVEYSVRNGNSKSVRYARLGATPESETARYDARAQRDQALDTQFGDATTVPSLDTTKQPSTPEAPSLDTGAQNKVLGSTETPQVGQENIQDPVTGNKYTLDANGTYQSIEKQANAGTTPSPYQLGFDQAKNSGAPAPSDAGAARGAVKSFTPPAPPDTTAIDTLFSEDKTLSSIFKNFQDYMSPPRQSETLLGQYKKLISSSGLNEINTELINTQKIIEGTEDDIRSEVTAAGGFSTNSQVLALASARNKTLIQNYNSLLETRKYLSDQVNTMIGLAGQDQEMAQKRAENGLNFAFKVADYQEKMKQNAREGYNNVISAIGYDGLYTSLQNDPYALSVAEKTLGLSSGQLSQAATVAQQKTTRANTKSDLELDVLRSNLKTDAAQRGLIGAQTAKMAADAAKTRSETTSNESINFEGKIETLDDIKNAPVSKITKAVMAGYVKIKDLTPTDKTKVAEELFSVGFNPQQYVLRKLNTLAKEWDSVPDNYKGVIQGRIQPYASSRDANVATFESTRQVLTREIARLNDVGMLSDEDVASYKSAMPSRGDKDRDVVDAKITGLGGALSGTIDDSPNKDMSIKPGDSMVLGESEYKVNEDGTITRLK